MPTRPVRSYGSFCPVAQASEVVAQRWVPLILREIMVGYHRFNEIRRALPLISPSVLAQRLKALEDDGVIRRRSDSDGVAYHLTAAGEELRPIVDSLGQWARKHFRLDGAPAQRRYWWIVVQRGEEGDVDVCVTDPGHPVTLTVTAELRTLVELLMGDSELTEVLRRRLVLVEGERALARRFEGLFDFRGAESFAGGT